MSKKARMNRGLDALFSDNYTPEKEPNKAEDNAVSTVSISLIEPNRNQPRTTFDNDKIAELSQSIKENGIIQPILVTPLENGGYRIVAGERRWRAARQAGLKEVPVFVRKLDDKQTMQLALIENVQRQDLSPIEEAKAYKQLMDVYSMTQQEVADAVGKSRSVIANFLRLLTLDERVVEMVEKGELSVGHAKMIAGVEDRSVQFDCAQTAVKEGFSVRQLEDFIKGVQQASKAPKQAKPSLKQQNPFLREFEINVNDNSNIKAKAKQSSKGATTVSLTIGKDINANEVLSKLAELLTRY